MFWFAIPPSQTDMQQVRPEYHTWDAVVEDDGLQWFSLTPGPLLNKAMRARYRAIRVYLEEGINVIADDLIWTREWLVDFLRIFEGYEVWLVGVTYRMRKAPVGGRALQRHPGTNRGSARAAYADVEYDFEIDTTDAPLPELAESSMRNTRPVAIPRRSTGSASAFFEVSGRLQLTAGGLLVECLTAYP